ADGSVAADHSAQVATSVSGGLLGRLRKAADPHQLVVDSKEWSLEWTRLGSGHMLPAALGQEAVITTTDKVSAVLKGDPIGGLNRRPVRQYRGQSVPAVEALADRAVNFFPFSDLGQRLRTAVRHQDRRLTAQAINARMLAAPVGVDGPAERHPGGL